MKQKKTSRDAQSTRESILDAALTVFSNKGYHDTRMDEIVEASKTSKGAIYFHFPNKEQLFLALVDQFASLLERRVQEATQAYPIGVQRVQIAIETVLATFSKYRRPAKILLIQAVGLGSVFEKKRQDIVNRFANLIKTHLDEAVDEGILEPIDTEVVSHAWMGAIYSLIIQWVYTAEPSKDRILETLVPLLLKSIGHDPE